MRKLLLFSASVKANAASRVTVKVMLADRADTRVRLEGEEGEREIGMK